MSTPTDERPAFRIDPEAALWTIALYAGEPDPLDLWEMDDGTQVDIGACVLALAGEMERLRKLHEHDLADAVRMADELAAECDNVDRARHGMMTARAERDAVQAEAERLRELLDLDAECAECKAAGLERDRMRKQFAALAERLRGERDDAERRAAMACEAADPLCPCDGCKLAAEAGAPEGEQP